MSQSPILLPSVPRALPRSASPSTTRLMSAILTVRRYLQSSVFTTVSTHLSRCKRNRDNYPHEPHDRPYFLS